MDAIGLMLDRADIYEMRDGSNAEDHFAGRIAAIEAEATAAEHERAVNACAEVVIRAIAMERARIAREAPSEKLPSGSHRQDRERAAFNEGRAAVLAIIEPPE